MAQALTVPMLIAAAVLCIAGVAKLRSPRPATRAFAALGLPASAALVRALAVAELAVGTWSALAPGVPAAAAVAGLYAAFALAAARLARSAVSCGCFGEDELPASLWQAVVSAVFAVLALGALAALAVHVSAHGHGLGWVLGRPVLEAGALIVGIGGAAYATVLAYTLLPYAWTSWNGSAP